MKILIAGASGAIGQPLIHFLLHAGHEVYGICQSEERSSNISKQGAKPLILDVLDKEAVFSAVARIKPDVIIDMLTRLPKEYTPAAMKAYGDADAKLRTEGGSNLQHAAEESGTRRYIAQSTAFFYAPGEGLANEHTPFAVHATPGIAAGSKTYEVIEKRVLHSKKIEGLAIRFGFFYGPGTWFHPKGNMGDQMRGQEFPLIGKGQGLWNFIHIEDAAKAIVSALHIPPGAYNIVNDRPYELREWLPAFAKYVGAPKPHHITEEEGQIQRGADSVYYAVNLRGASNAKAKHVFHFAPRPLEWL